MMTNMIITPDQTQGACPEDPELNDVDCTKDSDCQAMEPVQYGHGKMFYSISDYILQMYSKWIYHDHQMPYQYQNFFFLGGGGGGEGLRLVA